MKCNIDFFENRLTLLSKNKLSQLTHPSYNGKDVRYSPYSYGIRFPDYFYSDEKVWILKIGDLVPKALWQRHLQNRNYSNLCYNTALVSSGVLRLKDFNAQSSAILKYLSGRDLELADNSTKFIQNSNSVITKITFLEHELRMPTYLKSVISPGDILCLSDKANSIEDEDFGQNGHCMGVLTRGLIVESNYATSINLVSLDKAIRHHIDNMGRKYMWHIELNRQDILSRIYINGYQADRALLFEIMSELRQLTESLHSDNYDELWRYLDPSNKSLYKKKLMILDKRMPELINKSNRYKQWAKLLDNLTVDTPAKEKIIESMITQNSLFLPFSVTYARWKYWQENFID